MSLPENLLIPLLTIVLALFSIVFRSLVEFSLIETGSDLTFSAATLHLSLFLDEVTLLKGNSDLWSKTITDLIIFIIMLGIWGITLKLVQLHQNDDEISDNKFSNYAFAAVFLGAIGLIFEILWRMS